MRDSNLKFKWDAYITAPGWNYPAEVHVQITNGIYYWSYICNNNGYESLYNKASSIIHGTGYATNLDDLFVSIANSLCSNDFEVSYETIMGAFSDAGLDDGIVSSAFVVNPVGYINDVPGKISLEQMYNSCFNCGEVPSLLDQLFYIRSREPSIWSVPDEARVGDIVFFRVSGQEFYNSVVQARREFVRDRDDYSVDVQYWLNFWLNRELDLSQRYSNRIVAYARVLSACWSEPYLLEPSILYNAAFLDEARILKVPFKASEFDGVVSGEELNKLMKQCDRGL